MSQCNIKLLLKLEKKNIIYYYTLRGGFEKRDKVFEPL